VTLIVRVYFYASKDGRLHQEVELRMKRMINGGVGEATFSDLYFEAASAYAVSKGASKDRDADHAFARTVLNGTVYGVYFSRSRDGGTWISLVCEG
jgi:hypothetical protein